jgi:hypothetical protein
MKQSILFEKGKLYVVELPEKKDYGMFDPELKEEFDLAYAAALANKVEVKNPELLKLPYGLDHYYFYNTYTVIKDCDTFPLPDGIEVEIKHDWPNPCIPHKYCLENYELKKESCKTNCVRQKLVSTAILKRIEPEKKPNAEQILKKHLEHVSFITPNETFLKVIDAMQEYRHLVDPEKPEETQEVTLEEFLADIPPLYYKQETFVYTNLKLRGYTIQRKKS